MDRSSVRLASRSTSKRSRPPWPPGVRPLVGGLLLVPEQAEPTDLLVFFHGASGRAAHSLPLLQDVAARRGMLVLLPDSRSRTWDLVLGRPGPDAAALDAQLAEVMAAYDVGRVALAGFSDGASYALSLGVANGDLVEQVLAFSPGFVAPVETVGRPAVWVSHGTADPVLPVDRCGRRVVTALRAAGYDVEYVEFDGGHVCTPDLVAAGVDAWLS